MLRLLSLPFALLLAIVAILVAGAGVLMIAEPPADKESTVLNVALGNEENAREDKDRRLLAGGSLVGFGILGLIMAVVLAIVAVSGPERGPPQQQQQQVVVIERERP